ncbi:MAG: hypothetical protein MUC60_04985 [Oscillatoria sp. Prado101]|nr:hypothetical protein [Oscillatoria sp. Prado101]
MSYIMFGRDGIVDRRARRVLPVGADQAYIQDFPEISGVSPPLRQQSGCHRS